MGDGSSGPSVSVLGFLYTRPALRRRAVKYSYDWSGGQLEDRIPVILDSQGVKKRADVHP
jgi:hypothetical protein